MNLQVPPELEAKLTRLATETERTVDQVALDLLASSAARYRYALAKLRVLLDGLQLPGLSSVPSS